MSTVLTLEGEITADGHLSVEIPPETPRGRVVLVLQPAETAPRELRNGEAPLASLAGLPSDALRQRFDDLLERWGIQGEPVPIETLREMSRECGLEENELSRDLIAAREE